MKKLFLTVFGLLSLTSLSLAGLGDVRLAVVQSDGTFTEAPITFVSNGLVGFGSTPGTLVTVSLANYATISSLAAYATVTALSSYVTTTSLSTTLSSYALNSSVPTIKAGRVAFTVGALTKPVTFTTAMPTANYEVIVQPNGLSVAGWAVTQTVTGFTLTLSVAPSVAGNVGYVVVPDQN